MQSLYDYIVDKIVYIFIEKPIDVDILATLSELYHKYMKVHVCECLEYI